MGPAEGSGAVAGRVARPGAGGVVSRPGLFDRLAASARVTVVSAPPGSGKTVLLRSWIGEAGRGDSAAWVPVGPDERDPQRFWLSVLGALRRTSAGSALVRAVTAAPDLDGWAIVERLLKDLAPLADRTWLVLDDVHELGSDEARRQLELLVMRAPDRLRFVLATRHDLRLGLHRLRLEGELTELRAADLRFMLAEVLERQGEQVRRLLLRTSVLERVSGELADALTGGSGGERILQDLEAANAFVVALDSARSWFRYHRLFAGLLQLELRRTASDEVSELHRVAAGWYASHGFPVEAVRHAQGGQDWGLASRLLADHWPSLYLGGQAATIHELLAGFPAEARTADAELAALAAADELAQGSLEEAKRYLTLAALGSVSVPAGRRGRVQTLLGVVGLLLARQRGNPPAVAEEARRLQAVAEAPDAARPGLGEDLRALALINLGIAEYGTARFEEAEPHLEQGVALARRIGRPYLEFTGLAHQAAIEIF